LTTLIIRLAGLVAGYLKKSWKEVHLDKVDQKKITQIEDEFESKERIESRSDGNIFLM
jgi:hypothetical protein